MGCWGEDEEAAGVGDVFSLRVGGRGVCGEACGGCRWHGEVVEGCCWNSRVFWEYWIASCNHSLWSEAPEDCDGGEGGVLLEGGFHPRAARKVAEIAKLAADRLWLSDLIHTYRYDLAWKLNDFDT